MLERLQKIIARAGIASRRHAEELIRSGQVRVNGAVVTELGAKADPEHDRVEAAGRIAERPAEPAYFLLNKPVHVVSTMSDPEGRATLRHVLRGLAGRADVRPFGRVVRARLTHPIPSAGDREDHIRVFLEQVEGELLAVPVLGKSGVITTMTRADGVVVVPIGQRILDAGTDVDVQLFEP